MDFCCINPIIRSASIYEKINRSEECIGYDSRIIYMISGNISATAAGQNFGHLAPGNLLYIPAGVSYRLKSKYLRAVVVTFDMTDNSPLPSERISPATPEEFNPELCHNTMLFPPFDKPLLLEDMEAERENFIDMANIFTSEEGAYKAEISAMLKLVLLKIAETADENALPARMVKALDSYIRENICDEISNTEIGAIFGYHPFYISKVLKDKKGITLRQYIINYRLKSAKRALELTDKSANQIAEENGFTDASYFAKSFKAAFGVTPKEYRNKFKNEFI